MFEGGAIPVAEDSVEYHLYFKNQESMPHLMHQCNAYVKRLIGDYMWQVLYFINSMCFSLNI